MRALFSSTVRDRCDRAEYNSKQQYFYPLKPYQYTGRSIQLSPVERNNSCDTKKIFFLTAITNMEVCEKKWKQMRFIARLKNLLLRFWLFLDCKALKE